MHGAIDKLCYAQFVLAQPAFQGARVPKDTKPVDVIGIDVHAIPWERVPVQSILSGWGVVAEDLFADCPIAIRLATWDNKIEKNRQIKILDMGSRAQKTRICPETIGFCILIS